jgi:hypothetical protein
MPIAGMQSLRRRGLVPGREGMECLSKVGRHSYCK